MGCPAGGWLLYLSLICLLENDSREVRLLAFPFRKEFQGGSLSRHETRVARMLARFSAEKRCRPSLNLRHPFWPGVPGRRSQSFSHLTWLDAEHLCNMVPLKEGPVRRPCFSEARRNARAADYPVGALPTEEPRKERIRAAAIVLGISRRLPISRQPNL